MQELLRHASSRVTMDTYTQAVTSQKRKAQSDVVGWSVRGKPRAWEPDAGSVPFCAHQPIPV